MSVSENEAAIEDLRARVDALADRMGGDNLFQALCRVLGVQRHHIADELKRMSAEEEAAEGE
jgi:N-methylhydantoinase B/oxoprolinase/acetone carboxylase alpha subunit